MAIGSLSGNTMEDGDKVEDEEELEMTILDLDNIKVEEHVEDRHACPKFIISKHEELIIHRPWRRWVIVKLLGRIIGNKVLETRLKHICVRK